MVALAILFAASAAGITLYQVGMSPGKTAFFGTWIALVLVTVTVGRRRPVGSFHLLGAGALFAGTGIFSSICRMIGERPELGGLEVDIGMVTLGALLWVLGVVALRAARRSAT